MSEAHDRETHSHWVDIGTPTMTVSGFYREKRHAESGKKITWWSVKRATTSKICISLLFTFTFPDSLYPNLLHNFCEIDLEK